MLGNLALARPDAVAILGARNASAAGRKIARDMAAELGRAGRWDEARAVHFKLRMLTHLLFVEANPIPLKTALAQLGRIRNELRLPMTPALESTQTAMRAEMHALGLL